ncbi:hypothetical protein MGG_05853 [Pyricularia oryzae 70-15]|uniref:Tyrosine specific protein phosphatases domain-containing protein n=3 Tax=Pyricularia oryzae TaxID=318829 RepID=G4N3P6_PYRO7|nr:uncharacterized protein MGG_05853 [Pyricularia oryzae 70-15]EHA51870.1 hypothetical protein MGG_05853 [Pyricularia oryzae 70-15]ELQ44915.1 hypothetical protein OOU_Y34scaffold00036g2 [Pyricularia oryzae Y34]KAI7909159.1 hypothetical protein M9X92_011794 [Pyricularia oryzae]KAI7911637.1 hypothetical protein M0657_010834 [Pyricularia oryzae]
MQTTPRELPAKGPERPSYVPNIPNFRDVGVTVNNWVGRKILKEGVLYRSAAIEHASQIDRELLRDKLGIRTILDLRLKSERSTAQEQAQLVEGKVYVSSHIEGIRYNMVDLIGKDTKKYLLNLLGWVSWLRFSVLYYVLRNHMAAKRILSRELLRNRGMNGFLIDILDHGKAQILEALRALVGPPTSTPILIHCVHGKDRTGLITILILLALNVPRDAIAHDYHFSDQGLVGQRENTSKYMEAHGLDQSFATTSQGLVGELDTHIRRVYGGIDGYLSAIGFTASEARRLRECLAA